MASFPGEIFLTTLNDGEAYQLPNFSEFRNYSIRTITTCTIFVAILLPLVIGQCMKGAETVSKRNVSNDNSLKEKAHQEKSKQESLVKKSKRTSNKSKKKRHTIQSNSPEKDSSEPTIPTKEEGEGIQPIHPFFMPMLNVTCLVLLFQAIILKSPYNTKIPRGIFEAPMFTSDECETVIEMGHTAAKKMYTEALEKNDDNDKHLVGLKKDPKGWRKTRHDLYPTTDLNIVTDAFTTEDRRWIQEKLDARLAPLVNRVFGLGSKSAIRAMDIFLVRYDHDNQADLKQHTDNGFVSFNILLNNEFEGGGTRFEMKNGVDKEEIIANPSRGHVLIHSANIIHEGLAITSGTRYILVGFLNIDRVNPLSPDRNTGLNFFASWLNMDWVTTIMETAYQLSVIRSFGRYAKDQEFQNRKIKSTRWTDNKFVRSLFHDLKMVMKGVADLLADFHTVTLVDEVNATDYIKALDIAYNSERTSERIYSASWFQGQHLVLDFDGELGSVWNTRSNENDEAYRNDF